MSIYKKHVSIGKFLKKGTDIKDGDKVAIASEGKKQEGQFGMQDIFLIKLANGEEGNISLNQMSINSLIDGYGEDSVNWIGKEARIEVIKMSVAGKIRQVYFFVHPDAILDDESGEFAIPGKEVAKDDIPVIESDDPNAEAQIAANEDRKK